jgi:hypothetical protein
MKSDDLKKLAGRAKTAEMANMIGSKTSNVRVRMPCFWRDARKFIAILRRTRDGMNDR